MSRHIGPAPRHPEKAPLTEELDWQLKAKCRELNPEDWHPRSNSEGAAAYAKHICNTYCPVRDQCRQWALTHFERYGVWGGLSESDREMIWSGRRRRKTVV